MVILEQNHIEETYTMILATANLYSHLVQHAHTGSGLAGVEDLGVQTLEAIDIDSRLGCHAAHSLHNV